MSTQQMYNHLRKCGLSHAGALGSMGNFAAEAGCESVRLQGDFELSRKRSKEYAVRVDSGEMSKHIFIRDQQGWGLAQWTWYTRKENLYDFCKNRGASIGDETAQLDFFVEELRESFPDLYRFLCATDELYTATKRVCEEYERPAVNNVQARFAMAKAIESNISQASDEPKLKEGEYWPPRTLDKSMTGPDVEVIRAVLKARGFGVGAGYVFDDAADDAVRKFQKEKKLVVDGVVGPKTWAELLKI